MNRVMAVLALTLFASLANAESFDPYLKTEKIKTGSYVVFVDHSPEPRYWTYVFAGKKGDLVRLQVFRGRLPDSLVLVRTDYLDKLGQTVSSHDAIGRKVTGVVGEEGGKPLTITEGHPPQILTFHPHNCRRQEGVCEYWNEKSFAVPFESAFQNAIGKIYNFRIINTPNGTGYDWEEYRRRDGETFRLQARGTIEFDEMGFPKRRTYVFANGHVGPTTEQVEAVYY